MVCRALPPWFVEQTVALQNSNGNCYTAKYIIQIGEVGDWFILTIQLETNSKYPKRGCRTTQKTKISGDDKL